MILNYNDFFKTRRELIFSSLTGIPPIVDYKQFNNGSYNVSMVTPEGLYIESDIESTPEISDFETSKKQYCKKMNIPDGLDIKTHDFCDNTTWVNGVLKSIYCLSATTGKMLRVKRFSGVLDVGISFGSGQEFKVVLWESYDGVTACPDYVAGIPTTFGTPLYDPLGIPPIITGWSKVYPEAGDVQEVEVWLYFDNNVPKYKATCFTYPKLSDLQAKSDWKIFVNQIHIKFEYKQEGINILLRSSLKERIEFYINNDTQYTDPNNEGAVAAVSFHSYDEF